MPERQDTDVRDHVFPHIPLNPALCHFVGLHEARFLPHRDRVHHEFKNTGPTHGQPPNVVQLVEVIEARLCASELLGKAHPGPPELHHGVVGPTEGLGNQPGVD